MNKDNLKSEHSEEPKGDASEKEMNAEDRAQAKEMARAARSVARKHGKRITMSMFVFEPIVTI